MVQNRRVWLYLSSKEVDSLTQTEISDSLNRFLSSWAAHGTQLDANAYWLYNHVLVVALNEQQASASGCSIDKLQKEVLNIDAKYSLGLFERLKIGVITNQETLEVFSIAQAKKLKSTGDIKPDSTVLDLGISSEESLKESFIVPLERSMYASLVK